MTPARLRALLATTAAIAVLVHGLAGHRLSDLGEDHMTGAAVGLCLLLATVVVSAAAPKVAVHRGVVVAKAAPAYVTAPSSRTRDGRARASPSALMRFRN
jgi:hypothetical protein